MRPRRQTNPLKQLSPASPENPVGSARKATGIASNNSQRVPKHLRAR